MNSSPGNHFFSIIIPTFNRWHSLSRTLQSLHALDYPRDKFDIIVVNDGSTDRTHAFLEERKHTGELLVVHTSNAGPAVARNRGAGLAQGEILAFLDDDCTVPSSWLRDLNNAFHAHNADAVGGSVRNGISGNIYAETYQEMHEFFAKRLNRNRRNASFLTTNNFACRMSVFRNLGGFDERLHVGGEDREFVERLLREHRSVVYDPAVSVNHCHQFAWWSFVQQYFRFGKGSYLIHTLIAREKNLKPKRLPWKEYFHLFFSIGTGVPLFRRGRVVALAGIAQLSVLLGYVATAWEGVTDIVSERRRAQSAEKMGIQGRAHEMVEYVLGTAVSSALGFASFLLMGRALSAEQFGGFTFFFSVSSLLQTIGATGLGAAMSRHAVEDIKTGDPRARAESMKSAAVLFLLSSTMILALPVVLWDQLMVVAQRPESLEPFLKIFLAGTFAAMAFDFFGSAYAVVFRMVRLAMVRLAVSGARLCAIAGLLIADVTNPLAFYATFFLPNWIGTLLAVRTYVSPTVGIGRVSGKKIRLLGSYAVWQTFSSATAVILQHAGSIVLAGVGGKEEVGYYGLGLTMSFIYSVVGGALGSYFFPIAVRLRTNEDVVEFIRRTARLSLPVAALCLASLLVMTPFFALFFGLEKAAAAPVFLLLSLSAILGVATVGLFALIHYFFKPRLITYAQILGVSVFVLLSGILAAEGAIGMASANLGARIAFVTVMIVFIKRELAIRGITPVFRALLR